MNCPLIFVLFIYINIIYQKLFSQKAIALEFVSSEEFKLIF